jgi:pimeloyl-ACP methyl ester carboxylesterase
MAITSALILHHSGGKLAYTDAGQGPLVVMVPGLGDLKEEYRFLVPEVLAAGYRVVTMDIRGHGNSSVGWPDYSSAALGSDVVALVRHLGAGPAAVIGTSMGAGAAAWAAADARPPTSAASS